MLYLWEAHSIVLSAQDNISSNGMVSKNLNSSKFDHILIPSVKDIPALKKEKKTSKKKNCLMHVDHALHVHAHDKISIQYDFRV